MAVYEFNGITLDIGENRPSKFYEMLVKAADTHARKNLNYAGDGDDPFRNFRECEEFGVPTWKGLLVRMSDKWMRIKNLAKGIPDLVGESLEDTIKDLGVYSMITLAVLLEVLDDSRQKSTEDTGSQER